MHSLNRRQRSTQSCEENGAPEKIRTSDLQLRRLPLYPAELRARTFMVAPHSGASKLSPPVDTGVLRG